MSGLNNKHNLITNQRKRENEIKEAFEKNKLTFKNHGDCYSFINYGKPTLQEIIKIEQDKEDMKLEMHILLSKKLKDLNISMKDNIDICENFMKNGNFNLDNIDSIIKEIEIKNLLKNDKNYDSLINSYDKEIVQTMIFNKCMKKQNSKKNTYNKTLICFD